MNIPVIVNNLADGPIRFESRSPGNDNDADFISEEIATGAAMGISLNPAHDRIAVSNGGDVRKQIDISEHMGRPLVVTASGSVGSDLFITVTQIAFTASLSAVAVEV